MSVLHVNEGLNKLTDTQIKCVRDRLRFYESAEYNRYMEKTAQNRRYRFGEQWTREEKNARAANGKETLTINRIRKILNAIVGLKTASKPKFTAIPAGGEDHALSTLYDKLLDTAFYHSDGMEKLRNIVMYGDGDNIGYFFVHQDRKNRPVFTDLDYTQVVVDPNSSDSLFRDAECIYIKKWIPIERAKVLYGIDDFNMEQPKVWSSDYFASRQGDEQKAVEKIIDSVNMNVKIYEGYYKYLEEHEGSLRERIRVETIVGYNHIFKKTLPPEITSYPIVPYFVDFVPNPYRTGETEALKEIQDYINSAINITIEGARRNSNPETFLTEDMVDGDIETWRKDYNAGTKFFMVKKDRGGALPHTISGQPLNPAWFGLLNFFLSEQEFQSIPNQMIGFNDQSEKVRQDMIAKREAVMDSQKGALGHLDSALSQTGNVILQHYRAYVSPTDILYLVDGEKTVERYSVNAKVGLDLDNQESINRWKTSRLQRGDNPNQVDKDLMEAQQDKAFYEGLQTMFNPIKDIDVDVRVVSGSYSSSFEIQQFDRLMTMKQAGLHIDDEDIVAKAPIENSLVISQKASLNRSLMSENESFRHLIEELKARIVQLEGIISQGNAQSTQDKYEYKFKKQLDDAKMKGYVQKKVGGMSVNSATKLAKQDIANEVEMIKEKLNTLLQQAEEAGVNETTATLQSIIV